jgi:hypothetical protein
VREKRPWYLLGIKLGDYKIHKDVVVVAAKVKQGKAIPLQTWTGPEGSRRLRLPDFKTNGT